MQLPINIGKYVGQTSQLVLSGYKQAVKYLDPHLTVKATRRGKLYKGGYQQILVVTVGRPNYLEQKFIKLCKKAGEPFPIKKIQVK